MSSDNSQSLWNKMFIVKLSQGLLSVLVLILCTYDVTIMSFNGCEFAIFTGALSIMLLAYYVISVRTPPETLKLVAIVAGELVGVVIWLAAVGSLLAVYDVLLSYDESNWPNIEHYEWGYGYDDRSCNGDFNCHQMMEFMARDSSETFGPVLGAALACSALQVILYLVSLTMVTLGIVLHCTRPDRIHLDDNMFDRLEITEKFPEKAE